MPMTSEWVAPEVFLKRRGVTAYHVYRDDDIQQGQRTYAYTLRDLCGEQECGCLGDRPCRYRFDVRELPNYHERGRPRFINSSKDRGPALRRLTTQWDRWHRGEPERLRGLIREAIDHRWLTASGVALPRRRRSAR